MTEHCTSCEARVFNLLNSLGDDGLGHDATEEFIVHNAGVTPNLLKTMHEEGKLVKSYGEFDKKQIYYGVKK